MCFSNFSVTTKIFFFALKIWNELLKKYRAFYKSIWELWIYIDIYQAIYGHIWIYQVTSENFFTEIKFLHKKKTFQLIKTDSYFIVNKQSIHHFYRSYPATNVDFVSDKIFMILLLTWQFFIFRINFNKKPQLTLYFPSDFNLITLVSKY